MAFKVNFAIIKGCDEATKFFEKIKGYGFPADSGYGIVDVACATSAVSGIFLRRLEATTTKYDATARTVIKTPIEKVVGIRFKINPQKNLVETYGGNYQNIKELAEFLESEFKMAVVVEPIPVSIKTSVESLVSKIRSSSVKAIKIGDYSHDNYTIGPYTPKLVNSDGHELMEQFVQQIESVSLQCSAPTGRVKLKITDEASFGFTCKPEDYDYVLSLIRSLAFPCTP